MGMASGASPEEREHSHRPSRQEPGGSEDEGHHPLGALEEGQDQEDQAYRDLRQSGGSEGSYRSSIPAGGAADPGRKKR